MLEAIAFQVSLPPPSTLPSSPHANACRIQTSDVVGAMEKDMIDYAHKSGFKKAIIGLSGGIDSAVVEPVTRGGPILGTG